MKKFLYHKSPISFRKSILKNGLIPSVGDSYRAHWNDKEDLTPYVFLYDHDLINGGEYDSTYDDDIYAVDVNQLDKKFLSRDIDKTMKGCFVYSKKIPTSALKLVYKGSNNDSFDLEKHSHIYQENRLNLIIKETVNNFLKERYENDSNISFKEYVDHDDMQISIFDNNEEMGYLIIVIHKDIDYLDSEISDTDSPETAYSVIKLLDKNKCVIEIADIEVKRNYRNKGVSKMLIKYILNKFKNNQFYLRVYPSGGVDENTFVNTFKKFGFIDVDSNENGTFMIKK